MPDDSEVTWITPETPVYVLLGADGAEDDASKEKWGLLWGHGNPGMANLQRFCWAVAKVPTFRELDLGEHRRAVVFRDCEIIFAGERSEALSKLIECGADPDRISVKYQSKGHHEFADTGAWGTSYAGTEGIARAGVCGYAEAGPRGIALADEEGTAKAGEQGVAVVDGKRYGSASAGIGGIAVGRGRYKIVEVGNGGIAIAEWFGKVWAGNGGIAISSTGRAWGGEHSTVIGEVVSGGMGSLLISRHYVVETEAQELAFGIVGQNGLEPYVAYISKGGALTKSED